MIQMTSGHHCEETLGRDNSFRAPEGVLEHGAGADEADVLLRQVVAPQSMDKRAKASTFSGGQYDTTLYQPVKIVNHVSM
jgi:hypothetical protein